MALEKREKILAVAAGGLTLAILGYYGLSALLTPLRDRRAQVHQLQEKLEKQNQDYVRLQKAKKRLEEWNTRALPTDVEEGRLLYDDWLLGLTDQARWRKKKVDPAEAHAHKGIYTSLPFTVHGQGSLDELTRFLHAFYSAGHLHQIRRLNIKPLEKSSDFELNLTIEAISLPTADRKEELSAKPAPKPLAGQLADYQKAIGGRNMFAPGRPTGEAAVAFDHVKYVFVTGVTRRDGKPSVWLKARTTDQQFILTEGDSFQVGSIQGTVKRIGDREVEIEIEGRRRTVPLGENLRSGAMPRL
jgi:Tfp pilus assembly protein PilO